MGTSESRAAYPDCEKFYDAAMEADRGVRLPFQSYGAAKQFQTRCHVFRMLCRKDNAKIYPDPAEPLHMRSVYDPIRISIEGPDAASEYWVYAMKIEATIDLDAIEHVGDGDAA